MIEIDKRALDVIEINGMPYAANMRLLVNRGKIPKVIFGPGDVRRAHAPNEFVSIAELEATTRTLALSILRSCTTPTKTPSGAST